MALLEVAGLSAQVIAGDGGKKEVLHDVTLSLEPSTTTVLMGPNGAGKSTLGNVLMGNSEYKITGGKITFDGADITNMNTAERARAGLFLSFQSPVEVEGISLELFIKTALQAVTGERVKLFAFQKELAAKMELLGMDPSYASRDLNTGFSGGEKKKSEVLQLLMLKPKLAILDETDSGLDVDAVKVVATGIAEYKKAGGTLLIITHSTKLLEAFDIDKTVVLAAGQIVKIGDAKLVSYINENGFDEFLGGEHD